MEITFTCPYCAEVTLIDETYVGQAGECRTCGKLVVVPPLSATREVLPVPELRREAAPDFLVFKQIVGLVVAGFFVFFLYTYWSQQSELLGARQARSSHNLKEIALAMHTYHSAYQQLPRAYWTTSDGKRTMSWRVAILPFLEERRFIDDYRADEAWDSPQNLERTRRRPDAYATRGDWGEDASHLQTSYLVITGPGTLFEEGRDISLEACKDGTPNTILAVEVKGSGVAWAEPRDLDIRTMIMLINGEEGNSISSPWQGGAQVVMADGSVRFLKEDLLESTLRAMITRAGGEVVND